MKLSLLAASLFLIAGCAAGTDDHATSSANDTAVDLGANLITISGHLSVNGQSLDHALAADSQISFSLKLVSRNDGSVTSFVTVPAGVSTYSFQVPPDNYALSVEMRSDQVIVPNGDHPVEMPPFSADATFDIDVPLVKFTSNITANGQPLQNVTRLVFTDEWQGQETFYFDGLQVRQLAPFEAYIVPGKYNITASTMSPGPNVVDSTIPLATALVIQ